WIDDSEAIVLGEESLLVDNARFDVVNAVHVGNIRARPGIRQFSRLGSGLDLEIRSKVFQRGGARVVVVLVLANPATQRVYRTRADQVGPCRRNIEGLDLRALVRGSEGQARYVADGRCARWIARKSRDTGVILLVVGVWILKPGPREAQIQVNCIGLRDHV